MENQLIAFLEPLTEMDWLLLHKMKDMDGFKITGIDGRRFADRAFGSFQGFVHLEPEQREPFARQIAEATAQLQGRPVALAHLFLVIMRISTGNGSADAYRQPVLSDFRTTLGPARCDEVFAILAEGLNTAYFPAYDTLFENPGMDNWLSMFGWGGSYGSSLDFGPQHALQILKPIGDMQVEYRWLRRFSIRIRTMMLGTYQYRFTLPVKDALRECQDNPSEGSFLAAYVLFGSQFGKDNQSPAWLTRTLISYWMSEQWPTVGRDLLRMTFIGGNRFNVQSPAIQFLRSEINQTLEQLDPEKLANLTAVARYPQDFQALVGWITQYQVNMHDSFCKTFVLQSLRAMDAIVSRVAFGNGDITGSDPLLTYHLRFVEYRRMLSFIGKSLVRCFDAELENAVKRFAMQIVPLYFGRGQSRSLARNSTELLLILVFSCNGVEISVAMRTAISRITAIFCDLLLMPYVECVESQEAIWNAANYKVWLNFSTRQMMILAHQAFQGPQREAFADLFDSLQARQSFPWPYEDPGYVFETPAY